MNDDPFDELLTLAEAAALVGRAPVSLRSAVERGRLPARRFGSVWITTRAAVAQYVAEVAESPPPGQRWAHRQPRHRGRSRAAV